MSKYLTIAQAKEQFLNLPDELTNEPVIITQNGKPVMVTFSDEHIESLLETLEILNDQEIASLLDEAIQQDHTGKTINWEDAKLQLGW
jgi:PHD/YefM family antitoxin component YafN of YafNO toxin-antitoxin module